MSCSVRRQQALELPPAPAEAACDALVLRGIACNVKHRSVLKRCGGTCSGRYIAVHGVLLSSPTIPGGPMGGLWVELTRGRGLTSSRVLRDHVRSTDLCLIRGRDISTTGDLNVFLFEIQSYHL